MTRAVALMTKSASTKANDEEEAVVVVFVVVELALGREKTKSSMEKS